MGSPSDRPLLCSPFGARSDWRLRAGTWCGSRLRLRKVGAWGAQSGVIGRIGGGCRWGWPAGWTSGASWRIGRARRIGVRAIPQTASVLLNGGGGDCLRGDRGPSPDRPCGLGSTSARVHRGPLGRGLPPDLDTLQGIRTRSTSGSVRALGDRAGSRLASPMMKTRAPGASHQSSRAMRRAPIAVSSSSWIPRSPRAVSVGEPSAPRTGPCRQ